MPSNKVISKCGNIQNGDRGVTLVVVMMLLVLITGVSVWGVKQSIFSENVSRNQLDYEIAREAAETALRDAERDLLNSTAALALNASCARDSEIEAGAFTSSCHRGLCKMEDSAYTQINWGQAGQSEVWWPKAKGGAWNNNFSEKPNRVGSGAVSCNFYGAVPLGTYTGANPLFGVARQPEYLIEYFMRKNIRLNFAETKVTATGRNANQWSPMYRVTARGFGLSGSTQVVLQTIVYP